MFSLGEQCRLEISKDLGTYAHQGWSDALEMLGELADVTEIFFGRLTKIFKLDVLLELSDRS